MTTPHHSTMRRNLIVGVAAAVALAGLGVALSPLGSQAADPDDPTTAPVPAVEFPSAAGKALASQVSFNADGSVTAAEGRIHRGGTPATRGLPPRLVVELRDDDAALLGSFNQWDPREVRRYDPGGGHATETRDSGELSLIAPFEPALAEVVVTDGDTGEELVTIDATGPAATFCRDNPDDAGCAADLAISATASPDPAVAGESLTYAVTVDNQGPHPAHDVVMTGDLADGVAHSSDTGACAQTAGGSLRCELGRLPSDEAHTFEITVDVDPALVHDAGGPTTIAAQLAVADEAGSDPDPGDNAAEVTTRVEAEADLAVADLQMLSPPPEQIIGETDAPDVEAVITNHGPSTPMDVTTEWTADADDGVAVEPTDAADDTGALTTGDPETLTRTFTVACERPGVHQVRLTARVGPASDDDGDPHPANDQRTASFEVDCLVPISIDVKPGDGRSPINSRRSGVLPVALLSTDAGEDGNPIAFDATTVDVATTRVGTRAAVDADRGAGPAHDGHVTGSRGRGRRPPDAPADLLSHFASPADTELDRRDDELCVRGSYVDAASGSRFRFVGCDAVRVVR